MKELTLDIKRGIVAAVASFTVLLANGADFSADNSNFFAEYPDQLEFPIIILQPLNQLVPVGSSATFYVKAENEPLTYQWLRNCVVMPGETNSSLMIADAKLEDVGLYSCNVAKDLEIVPTRGAHLMVYAATNEKGAGMDSGMGPVTVWATPVTSSGTKGSCPGSYAGYVNYTKTVAQGWGWAPSSGTTNHTAADMNRTDTKVEYGGKLGDVGCNQTTVSVPHPTYSTKYRFTIYFPNNVPTNSYSITLDGFDP